MELKPNEIRELVRLCYVNKSVEVKAMNALQNPSSLPPRCKRSFPGKGN